MGFILEVVGDYFGGLEAAGAPIACLGFYFGIPATYLGWQWYPRRRYRVHPFGRAYCFARIQDPRLRALAK